MKLSKMKLGRFQTWYSLLRKGVTVSTWSIKVFRSDSFISSAPENQVLEVPSLQASDITDVPAEFVADPFIIHHNHAYFLFFEILNKATGLGEIGVATSADGTTWKYDQVVLREKYHLSYPQVFIHNNEHYMLPETSAAGQVILYKAKNFPCEWEVSHTMIEGKYLDPSVVYMNDKWWMFAGDQSADLHIFHSETLEGPWLKHPQSPVVRNNDSISRSGGRLGRVRRTCISLYTIRTSELWRFCLGYSR